MMLRCVLFVLLVSLAPLSARSQITLTADDYPFRVGETITTKTFKASPEPGSAEYAALQTLGNTVGDNQTWDLRTISFGAAENKVTRVKSFDANGPGGSVAHFAGAMYRVDFLITDNPGSTEDVYSFKTLDDTGLRNYGDFKNIGGQQQIVKNAPIDLSTMLPLTAGMQWVSNYTQSTDVIGYTYVQQLRVTHTVEGWGTLIMPDGTVLDCLRLRTSTEILDETGAVTIATVVRVEFLTKQGRGAELHFDTFVTNAWNKASHSHQTVAGTTAIETVGGAVSTATQLLQSFPNPAAETSTIEFSVAEATNVQLSVFDVLGREVAQPVDDALPVGRYRVAVALSELPVGTYIYRLRAGGVAITRRMMVVR